MDPKNNVRVDLSKSVSPNLKLCRIISHWIIDDNDKLYLVYHYFVLLSMLLYNVSQAMHVIIHIDNLEEISATIYNSVSMIGVMIKLAMFLNNFEIVKKLVDDCANVDIFQPKNAIQERILLDGVAFSRLVFFAYFYIGTATGLVWIFYPLLDKERRLPSNAWFPYDHLATEYYWPTYVWQSVLIFYHGMANVSMDTLFSIAMVQLGAQCDILRDSIKNLGEDDGISIEESLISCINHHRLILEFSGNIKKAFGGLVFAQFSISVLTMCQTMFMLSLVEDFNAVFILLLFYAVAIFTQIFLYCWFGNHVITKSDDLCYAVFISNWIDASNRHKKNLIFLMKNTQKPIVLHVGYIFPISLTTCTNILKTSWAYYAALRHVHDD